MDFPPVNSNTVEYILQTVTVRSILTRTENTQAKGFSSKLKGWVDSRSSSCEQYI